MIGRVYVNELAPGKVSMDFSARPAHILYDDNPYGFAYGKTLEHLGIGHQRVGDRTLLLNGNIGEIQANVPGLHRHIGLIARYGAQRERETRFPSMHREAIGRILGKLTQETLIDLPEDSSFTKVSAVITRPFAEEANDPMELFYMHMNGGEPWWLEADQGEPEEIKTARDAHAAERAAAIFTFLEQ